ncbi:LOW QUALITY PROTEIN: hypothetical protein Cgig2_015295 [Carnegiea gigantea]|uniref:Uncharacterized protein n=1 Tax=Carnegiea gigantea TaxID=171969 RepID=A0A9Q1JEF0_9CARY|nr:LOW QUALITY PROTEIN: hypothetical protein Cgig2_015295 [Carnegiea gigantea]
MKHVKSILRSANTKRNIFKKPSPNWRTRRRGRSSYRTLQYKKAVSDAKPSNSSDSEENDPTYECKEADHKNEQIEAKEEVTICQHCCFGAGESNHLRKELQIVQEDLALKSEGGASEKRTYQKTFIMRMPTRSFSSLLNKAQAEAVRSIGFAPFLKVDVKQIPGKFSELLEGQKFPVTAFDAQATLGVPLGERKTSKSSSL